MSQRPSEKIIVCDSDITMLWPLLINAPRPAGFPLPVQPDIKSWCDVLTGKGRFVDGRVVRSHDGSELQFGAWERTNRPYPNPDLPDADVEYAENIYFHSFARKFLYKNELSAILQKKALTGQFLEFDWHQAHVHSCSDHVDRQIYDAGNRVTIRVRIRQVQLHLFENRVAMLAVKLDEPRLKDHSGEYVDLTLEWFQRFLNQSRNAYPPFFETRWYLPKDEHDFSTDPASGVFAEVGGEAVPVLKQPHGGLCPDQVTLRLNRITSAENCRQEHLPDQQQTTAPVNPADALSACVFRTTFTGKASRDFNVQVLAGRETEANVEEPPTATWLKAMLYPLTCPDHDTELKSLLLTNGGGWRSEHTGCGLTFRHLVDHRIPVHAWVAVDDPRTIGRGDWMRLAWVEEPGNDYEYPYAAPQSETQFRRCRLDRFWHPDGRPPGADHQTTRWLVSGYAFLGVGQGGSDFFNTAIRGHIRHHYFRLVMHAHFLKASLLSFESQIAHALTDLNENEDDFFRREEFEQRLNDIQTAMVRFRSRYWFSEITNQMQGQELFQMLKEHLNLQPLFDEVFGEMKDATDIVLQWNQERAAKATSRLTVVASVFLVLVPAAEVLWSLDRFHQASRLQWMWPLFVGGGLGALAFSHRIVRLSNWLGQVKHIGIRLLVLGIICLAALGVATIANHMLD